MSSRLSVRKTTARVLAERRQAAERERRNDADYFTSKCRASSACSPALITSFEYVNDAYVAISGPRTFVGRSVREVLSGARRSRLL